LIVNVFAWSFGAFCCFQFKIGLVSLPHHSLQILHALFYLVSSLRTGEHLKLPLALLFHGKQHVILFQKNKPAKIIDARVLKFLEISFKSEVTDENYGSDESHKSPKTATKITDQSLWRSSLLLILSSSFDHDLPHLTLSASQFFGSSKNSINLSFMLGGEALDELEHTLGSNRVVNLKKI
jgi:hypothetical protein